MAAGVQAVGEQAVPVAVCAGQGGTAHLELAGEVRTRQADSAGGGEPLVEEHVAAGLQPIGHQAVPVGVGAGQGGTAQAELAADARIDEVHRDFAPVGRTSDRRPGEIHLGGDLDVVGMEGPTRLGLDAGPGQVEPGKAGGFAVQSFREVAVNQGQRDADAETGQVEPAADSTPSQPYAVGVRVSVTTAEDLSDERRVDRSLRPPPVHLLVTDVVVRGEIQHRSGSHVLGQLLLQEAMGPRGRGVVRTDLASIMLFGPVPGHGRKYSTKWRPRS